ncbi:MAG: glycosyltransferase family 9 protein [Alphaproteobacteria bacterium]|nr:glycosyltransferase family 9 protein [Alphaproteobacteria bacterium]
MTTRRNILVIKLGAFGDFIMALGAFAAIRRHHADDRVTLLTIPGLVALAEASGCFDEVWADRRKRDGGSNLSTILRLRRGRFDLVYDLQTNDRTNLYHQGLRPFPPQWSGTAFGCSDPDPNPARNRTHGTDRYEAQLRHMGIAPVPAPDPGFITAETGSFDLPRRFVMLVPGSSPQHPEKRWPAASYAALGRMLIDRGLTPVLLGTEAEAEATAAVADAAPGSLDLTGRTSIFEIGGLAEQATGAVGNDTGPMHLIAAKGCPSVVLYSGTTRPSQTAQRGPAVTILQEADLATLTPRRVADALAALQPPQDQEQAVG